MGKTPRPTEKSVGEAHRVLECTQTHLPVNSHLKGPNTLVGNEGSDRKRDQSRASKWHCSLSDLCPKDCHNAAQGCPTWRIPKAPPLTI